MPEYITATQGRPNEVRIAVRAPPIPATAALHSHLPSAPAAAPIIAHSDRIPLLSDTPRGGFGLSYDTGYEPPERGGQVELSPPPATQPPRVTFPPPTQSRPILSPVSNLSTYLMNSLASPVRRHRSQISDRIPEESQIPDSVRPEESQIPDSATIVESLLGIELRLNTFVALTAIIIGVAALLVSATENQEKRKNIIIASMIPVFFTIVFVMFIFINSESPWVPLLGNTTSLVICAVMYALFLNTPEA